MIFSDMCSPNGTYPGSCVCTNGTAHCNDGGDVPGKCWPGEQIHDPCDGFETGCTADGILVKCGGDPKTGHMIFSNTCSPNGTYPGSCICTNGTSYCQETDDPDDPECWPGEQIHDPCDGFETGCTVDGILVKCDGDPKTGHMIFSNMCSPDGTSPGSCTCTKGYAHCADSGDVPGECWQGKEIHDPCDGYKTGCNVDGILVICDGDPETGDMIADEDCPTSATCVCIDGISKCGETYEDLDDSEL